MPEDLAGACARLKMPAMALLDTDGVYGAPRFHMAAKKLKIKAHIGAEVTAFLPRSYGDTEKNNQQFKINSHKFKNSSVSPCLRGEFRLPLLVSSRAGYQNLCRMITKMKLRAKKGEGVVQKEELEEHGHGLICLTGGADGPLATALQHGGMEEARRQIEQLISLFGRGNVYIELQRHFHREEEARNRAAIAIARSLNLPLLATNGVCYATEKNRELCDAFTAIRHHRTLSTAGRLLARNSERYLKSPQEMQQLFADLPEALANTLELSSRLEFTLNDLGYEFPRYPVTEGETMNSFLRDRAWEGFRHRYGRAKADVQSRARSQIERELALIEKLKLAGYFLIVWDLVRFCREQNILVQGRGSAANSAVCYSLGITAVDPISMELLFERFLSEERGEWPDIDLDLPSGDQRERAIQYVYQRYGELGAAMTANVITYRGRSAAREAGKALGFDAETLNRLTKLVSTWEWRGENDTLEHNFQTAGFDIQHRRIAKYVELCQRMQDLPRHLGQHSGGMVICGGRLNAVVPIEPASMPGRTVVQWDKEDCADMKIIKVDLLGLGMMAVLKDCLELVPHHYHEPLDLAQLPQNDPSTYRALQRADTVGMFQVESRAQMSALPRNHPTRFYDLVVQVAIIRPGPIVGNMMNPYMKRRRGLEKVSYYHPLLQPVLERTLGIPLFQEQLIRMAMIVANFSGGEAEELRRAVGMRRSMARMQELDGKLRRGMTANEVPPKVQDEIIQSISSFALYGFPESHAASFALIAYASAYLKCNYLAAFTAALLNNQPMGFYSPATIVKDAQRHGLRVKPVDVQHSGWPCTLEPEPDNPHHFALRLGLCYARGLRRETALAVIFARNQRPFSSIHDLALRVPPLRKSDLTLLANIGALNSVGEVTHRRDALWQVEYAGRPAGPLLNGLPEQLAEPSPLLQMTTEERLVADFSGTGVTVGPHPMAFHRAALERMGILPASSLPRFPHGHQALIAGCVIARQRPGTAKGFVFLSLEDETGIANAIITPTVYEQFKRVVIYEKFLLIEGELQNQQDVVSVKAHSIRPLEISAAEVRSHDFH